MSRPLFASILLLITSLWASAALATTGYLGAGFDVFSDNSLRIREVAPDSPAARVGLKAGDIVLSIDGEPFTTPDTLVTRMKAAQPGEVMTLRVRRDGQEREYRATLIDHRASAAAASAPSSSRPASADTKAYCKAMYAKAYALCGTLGDRDCKFLAADHWEICEKTGRWP